RALRHGPAAGLPAGGRPGRGAAPGPGRGVSQLARRLRQERAHDDRLIPSAPPIRLGSDLQVFRGGHGHWRRAVRSRMAARGWPVVLHDPRSGVLLRPYDRGDARPWSRCRIANEAWLSVWEPTPHSGTWAELNSPAAFRMIHRELRRIASAGGAMP